MNRVPNPLIDQLASEMEPVKVLKTRDGLALVALAAVATVLLVEYFHGLWLGAMIGEASIIFYIAHGLILLMGLASATSVLAMARPQVGSHYDGARWTMAMVGVIPIVAVSTIVAGSGAAHAMADPYGVDCMLASFAASLVTGAALVFWLRRGAPVSLNTAGWHTGVAAGALGTVAYGMSCPLDGLAHIGVWHIAPIVIAAMVGRLVVPKLVRW
ncbi:NrsF family protein [Altererythrobacter sp. MF3-039]|uniref:NrsF family protein n=1 Tax=Altererythrobacter sp. MF3-039 TaxID=3252901 RepID=UPI00390CD7AE